MGKNRSLRYLDPACGLFGVLQAAKSPVLPGQSGVSFCKRELVGVKLRHFACAKTFCRSNTPQGCLLLAQTQTCRGLVVYLIMAYTAKPRNGQDRSLQLILYCVVNTQTVCRGGMPSSRRGEALLIAANANLISSSKRLCFNFLLCISLLYLYFRFHIHHVLI